MGHTCCQCEADGENEPDMRTILLVEVCDCMEAYMQQVKQMWFWSVELEVRHFGDKKRQLTKIEFAKSLMDRSRATSPVLNMAVAM